MLCVALGFVIPEDSELIAGFRPVSVTSSKIRFYRTLKEEDMAFVYQNRNGSYTVTGVLAVDSTEKKFKLARPGGKTIVKEENKVFMFGVRAKLILDKAKDKRLFHKYYPHCARFGA